jgi:phosphate transport system permease protein
MTARSKPLYAARRRRNRVALGLSVVATLFGLGWLVLILGVLLWEGFSGLSLRVFTEMTPPPGSDGGLLNPIMGSLIMTGLAVLIGTPVGIFAGTYMAEYGRYGRTTTVVRFINDILLSAPSIVIGLFVYEVMVATMGHFSGLAGAVSLAVIVVPVVVRTTEDMLLLVPNSLREAAAALGMPRAYVIRHVAYRAARAGIVTGVLLAIARISGETARCSRAQQPVLEHQPQCADGRFRRDLPIRAEPLPRLAKLAWTGAHHHPCRACAQHHRAHPRSFEKGMTVAMLAPVANTPRTGPSCRAGISPQTRFLLRRQPGAQGDQPAALRQTWTTFIGPPAAGNRRCACSIACTTSIPTSAPPESHVRRREHPVSKQDVICCARIGMVFQKPTPFP